jgi:hypothetical protein
LLLGQKKDVQKYTGSCYAFQDLWVLLSINLEVLEIVLMVLLVPTVCFFSVSRRFIFFAH